METTTYRIKPGAGDEPKAKPPVDVSVEYGPAGTPTLRVGDCLVVSVTSHGKINRLHVDRKSAAAAGLQLDSHDRVAIYAEPAESDVIADAVKAEREACAEVVYSHGFLPVKGAATSPAAQDALQNSIATRILARVRKGDGEGAS